jgi:hypothetical protein
MATLTVIPYEPSRCVIRKPSVKRISPQSSSVKNVRFDFTDVPIEKLESSGGTGGNNLQRKSAGDSKPTTDEFQASKDILARTQGMCSDYIRRSVRLSLMLSDSLDRRETRL